MPLRSLLDFLTVTILARALSAPAFVPRLNSIDSTSYDEHVVRIHDDARVVSFDRRATLDTDDTWYMYTSNWFQRSP